MVLAGIDTTNFIILLTKNGTTNDLFKTPDGLLNTAGIKYLNIDCKVYTGDILEVTLNQTSVGLGLGYSMFSLYIE